MTRRTAAILLLLLGALAAALGPAGCRRQAERCWVCDREIHPGVVATITLEDGRRVHACCPRCALHYKAEPGNRAGRIDVTDFADGGALPIAAAWLVEGSDATPCLHHPPVVDETRNPLKVCYDRCMPSLIAFGSGEAARAFMTDHGGALHTPGQLPALPPAQH